MEKRKSAPGKRIISLLTYILFLCMMSSLLQSVSLCSGDDDYLLNVRYPDEVAIENTPVKIFRITDEKGNVAEKYRIFKTIIDGFPNKVSDSAAETMFAYISYYKIEPEETVFTNRYCTASFETEKGGMFFVVPDSYLKGNDYIDSAPFFVSLPYHSADSVSNSVSANVKMKYMQGRRTYTDISVKKIWEGEIKAESVKVALLCGGEVYGEAELSEENNWEYIFGNLENGRLWQVIETEVPDGCRVTVERGEKSFTVTNAPPTPEEGGEEFPDNPGGSDNPGSSEETDISGGAVSPSNPDNPGNPGSPDSPENSDKDGKDGKNGKTPEKSERIIAKTGMMWLPVIPLGAGGLLILIIALILKKKAIKIPVLVLSLAVLASAAVISGNNLVKEQKSVDYCEGAVSAILEEITGNTNIPGEAFSGDDTQGEKKDADAGNADGEKTEERIYYYHGNDTVTCSYGGTEYMGLLTVEDLDLCLPVASDFSYENLYSTPCVYSEKDSDALIICGHNYIRQFGHLPDLARGASVLITGADGKNHRYTVDMTEILSENEYGALTDTDYPLTLFTCDMSGRNRIAVRCVEN